MAEKQSEERYRAIVENQTEMICCFQADGTITFVNDAYCRYFDKNQKELIGHKFLPLIPDYDREKVYESISNLSPKKTVVTHEHRVLNPNGEVCWHKWTNRAIFDDQNTLKEYQAVGWDITDRKKAEEMLRQSEKRFRTLVETMTDGLGIQDKNGLISYVNNKFCQMLNYRPHDFIGRPVAAFLDDKNKKKLKEQLSVRKRGKVKPYELVWERKDGTKVHTMMSPQAIFDDKNQFSGSFAVITDISELKRTEKKLQKARDELEQRVEARTKELEIKNRSLEDLNIAMKVLLEKRAEDKVKLEDNVLANVRELITPMFGKIKKTKLDDHQKMMLNIIESNLNEITSPFTRKLSMKHLNLTPTELKIANYIKHGTATKKIAELMKSSPRTIETHRKNIRKKIGLDKKRKNLRSFLLSIN